MFTFVDPRMIPHGIERAVFLLDFSKLYLSDGSAVDVWLAGTEQRVWIVDGDFAAPSDLKQSYSLRTAGMRGLMKVTTRDGVAGLPLAALKRLVIAEAKTRAADVASLIEMALRASVRC